MQNEVALRVELANGYRVSVKGGREVLVCDETYRSPQVLMFSGSSDKSGLEGHGILQLIDLQHVSKRLS